MIGVPDDVFVDGTADPELMDGVCVGLVAELVEDPDVDVWSDGDDEAPVAATVATASLIAKVAVEPTIAARLTNSVTRLACFAG
ncbi:MAG: hypothetical protein M3P43_02695 [Actinomycetota bacterium]|nr:hypothetical protein [Actinomycetota bacterium]